MKTKTYSWSRVEITIAVDAVDISGSPVDSFHKDTVLGYFSVIVNEDIGVLKIER